MAFSKPRGRSGAAIGSWVRWRQREPKARSAPSPSISAFTRVFDALCGGGHVRWARLGSGGDLYHHARLDRRERRSRKLRKL